MKKELPRVYLDMDGVLCDFGRQIEKATGKSKAAWLKIPTSRKWDTVLDYPNFWANMPWLGQGKVMYNFVKKYNPHILSAYMEKTFDPNCIPGKSYWARTNLGIGTNRINLVKRVQKQNYAKTVGVPAVLIDDYKKNTDQFTQRGGIGILHTSTSNTIRELKKLGF